MSGLLKGALSSLITSSNDAQANLYKVRFYGGILDSLYGSVKDQLTIRCSGITPPMPSQDSYQVKYVTAYVDRPVTKVGLTRNFSLEFRADSYWNVYKALLALQKNFMDESKSWVNINFLKENGQPDADKFFNVDVNYLEEAEVDDTSLGKPLYRFNYCWIDNITPPTFDTSSGEPVTVSCSINFLDMDDWQSGISGNENYSESMVKTIPKISYK